MPEAALSSLNDCTYFYFTTIAKGRYYPHFINKESEASEASNMVTQ
jgi:hypothetical protein